MLCPAPPSFLADHFALLGSHPALTRSRHSLTVIDNKAFIFGGQDAAGHLCPPGVHTITLPETKTVTRPTPADETYQTAYTCYPPYTLQDPSTGEVLVPRPRSEHAACAWGRTLLVHGGRDGGGRPIAEDNCLWQWDTERLCWAKLRGDSQIGAAMAPRYGHHLFADAEQEFLVLVGGRTWGEKDADTDTEADTETGAWFCDFHAFAWTSLPRLPGKPLAAAYARGKVYVISRDGGTSSGGAVHFLDMLDSADERAQPAALVWRTVTFPAYPLAPGPKPRAAGALVPLATGYGREYLMYMFGCSGEREYKEKKFYSDVWTLQLPGHGLNPAAAKDKIKKKLPGMESGEFRWAEAEIVPTEQMTQEGKAYPGPRGFFGADACLGGRGVVLWGGVNAKSENESDGWILRLAHGYADSVRWD